MYPATRIVHLIECYATNDLHAYVRMLAEDTARLGLETHVIAWGSDANARQALTILDVHVVWLPHIPSKVQRALRIANALRRSKPTIIHTHDKSALYYGGVLAKLLGAKHIHTEHVINPYDTIPLKAEGQRMSHLAHVVALSEATARWRREDFGEHCPVIPTGVTIPSPTRPEEHEQQRRKHGWDDTSFIIGCCERLTPESGHQTLLEAVAKLVQKGIDAKVVLLNDGSMRSRLESHAASLGISDALYFIQADQDRHSLLQALDAVALANTSAGLPLHLLEAMASGLPVVATAVGATLNLLAPAAACSCHKTIQRHLPRL